MKGLLQLDGLMFGDAWVRLARAIQSWVIPHNPAAVLRPGDGTGALRVYRVLGNVPHVCLLHVTREFSLDTLTRDDHLKTTLCNTMELAGWTCAEPAFR